MKRVLSLFSVLSMFLGNANANSFFDLYLHDGTKLDSGDTLVVKQVDQSYYEQSQQVRTVDLMFHARETGERMRGIRLSASVLDIAGCELFTRYGMIDPPSWCQPDFKDHTSTTVENFSLETESEIHGEHDVLMRAAGTEIGDYFSCIVKLEFNQIDVIYVRMEYDSESTFMTGIDAVRPYEGKPRYLDMQGRQTPVRSGLLIEQLPDGRCRKVRL